MRAMILEKPGTPLRLIERPDPQPGPGQLQVKIAACGVCRTDLHVVDGDLTEPKLPIIPGHEIVGNVSALGVGVEGFGIGDRIGIPWLGHTCGRCSFCRSGAENLCDEPGFTGYQIDGGYADMTVADARYCFALGSDRSDAELAPLLCAGLIGYRSLVMAGDDSSRLGIYGFGAAAHIVAQVARYQQRELYAFTSPGDATAQRFALELGAAWAGGSDQPAPVELDAAIIFAPVGPLVPAALRAVRKGGVVVCGGIHMSDIPSFPYSILWGERVLRSVANLTRQDAIDFLELAPKVPVQTRIEEFPLQQANQALQALRDSKLTGAAVLSPC
ncbi:MAG: zinc-dependent alcohol dehydrogenase family protein [Gammaproteobacteria bacterium]|nr:zinc-dependent alcohol dehydrogenase family protein [Gammaproteobacteria bacterium]MDH3536363.1 zinc-dependent alcohol dehydrogenase family protein [Gammaproteobacteria bacterium]